MIPLKSCNATSDSEVSTPSFQLKDICYRLARNLECQETLYILYSAGYWLFVKTEAATGITATVDCFSQLSQEH